MNIVLHQPEIPQNTGNIGRTCVLTGTSLHLIRPLGFDTSEKAVLRAGLDYWKDLDVHYYDSFADLVEKHPNSRIIMATTKAQKTYDSIEYKDDDFIMFGRESKGIPEEILLDYRDTCVRIPMMGGFSDRSLNLSNSAAIILYEALRQQGFGGFVTKGELHRHKWDE